VSRILSLLKNDRVVVRAPTGHTLSHTLSTDKARVTIIVKSPTEVVPLNLGENWQAKLDAHPHSTQFRVAAGVHKRQTIRPKDGQIIDGMSAATMDGEGVAELAIGGNAKDVVICNLAVRNYKTPGQRCAIHLDRDISTASGWLLEDLLVHNNAFGGVALGDHCTMRGGKVHANGYIGVKASGTRGAKFIGVEVANNHTRPDDPYVECGGSKFVSTRNLLVQGCTFDGNRGPGIWTDHDNVGAVIEGNVVANNDWAGIFHEISGKATIRRNKITGNGRVDGGWIWHAGILVACSRDVEIYENELDGNLNGISLIQQRREKPEWIVENVHVHHNKIRNTLHSHGAAQDVGDTAIFTSRNNRFTDNHYINLAHGFAWDGDGKTWAQWQAAGNDLEGSYK